MNLGPGRKATAMLLVLALFAFADISARAQIASGVAKEQLQRLYDGNRRYLQNGPQRPNQRPNGGAQTPFAAVVSCADARVAPEILFDQGVNDLFVVRVAGNTVGDPASQHPAETDTIQLQSLGYAVNSLGVKLIVVLGHDQCGAVRGALGQCGQPSIGPMFQNVCPAVRRIVAASWIKPDDRMTPTIAGNVEDQVKLLKQTPPFAEKVKKGELRIVGALYELTDGKVSVFIL